MTEKEKARQGLLYDANYDPALALEREQCQSLLFQYNQLSPQQSSEKKQILQKLLGKTGKNFIFTPPFFCDYGYNIEIGENFYANTNLVILDAAKVRSLSLPMLAYTQQDILWISDKEMPVWNTPGR